ncbi:MAG: type II secretion system protein M [Gammaproteobacteria bacterium]|nr:type II secretion system protein M [Gammaproteobacteria bacterium]
MLTTVIRLYSKDNNTVDYATYEDNHLQKAITNIPINKVNTMGRVIVLIPSQYTTITKVKIPVKNRKTFAKAVPYALENNLLDEAKNLHFAIGAIAESTPVVIIKKSILQNYLDLLSQHQIKPDYLLPDLLILPFAESKLTIYSNENESLTRTGETAGFVGSHQNIEIIAKKAQEKANKPIEINRIIEANNDDFYQTIAPQITKPVPINLLQGAFKAKIPTINRNWWLVSIMAILCIILAISSHKFSKKIIALQMTSQKHSYLHQNSSFLQLLKQMAPQIEAGNTTPDKMTFAKNKLCFIYQNKTQCKKLIGTSKKISTAYPIIRVKNTAAFIKTSLKNQLQSNINTKITNINSDAIELSLDNVSFDYLVNWIEMIWLKHNLVVYNANINKKGAPGMVSITLKIKNEKIS